MDMTDIDIPMDIGSINNFVFIFAGAKSIEPGESIPVQTKSQEELWDIHIEYKSAKHKLDANTANNDQQWQKIYRKLQSEYGPRYQAWSDKHKLHFRFIWDNQY